MTRNSPWPSCNSRVTQRARRAPRLAGDARVPLPLDPHELELVAAVIDPTPGIDVLLDLLDDPQTPPAVAATIRDWLDS